MRFNAPLRRGVAALLFSLSFGARFASGVQAAPPANDICANAFEPFTTPYDFVGLTDEATTDGATACGASGKDVWWKITPPATARYTLTTCDSTFDSVLSVHTGCPGTELNQIACSDDDCGDDASITIVLQKNVTYLVRIAGRNGASGSYAFHVAEPVPAPEPVSPDCNILFAVRSEPGGGGTPALQVINPLNGSAVDIGSLTSLYGTVTALAYDEGRGRLVAAYGYGLMEAQIAFIYPDSLYASSVGPVGYPGQITDLTFDNTGRLFGFGEFNGARNLIELDPANGSLLSSIGLSLGGTNSGMTFTAGGELLMVNNGTAVTIDRDNGTSVVIGTPTYFLTPPFYDPNAPGLTELATDPRSGRIFGLLTSGGIDGGITRLAYYDEATNAVVPIGTDGYDPVVKALAFGCRCTASVGAQSPSPADDAVNVDLVADISWASYEVSALQSGPRAVSGSPVFSSGPPDLAVSTYEASTYKYASDFYVPSQTLVQSIRLWSLESSPGYDGTGVQVVIRSDVNSAPGAVIWAGVGFPSLHEATGRSVEGLDEYVTEFGIIPAYLERGTYWISFQFGQNCDQDNVYLVHGTRYRSVPHASQGCLMDAFSPLPDGYPDIAFEIFGSQDQCGTPSYTLLLGTENPPVAVAASGLTHPWVNGISLAPTTTYYWQVLTTTEAGTTPGPIWKFTTLTRPVNDDCISAIDILEGDQFGDTTYATADGSDSCNGSGPDIWYRYIPSSNGTAHIQTCGSEFDTVLSVHSGCPGTSGNVLICNDDSNMIGNNCVSTSQSELDLPVTAGQTYLIRVAGYQGAKGLVTLTLDGPAPDRRGKGDFNASGCTDLEDFLFLLDYWQAVSPIGGDPLGLVDFLALLDNWRAGPTCP